MQFFGHPNNSLAIRILLDLNTYRGVDPLGVSPLFLKKVVDIIAQKLRIVFGRLIRLGSFPESWQSANVTANPKAAPSPDRENYRPISITPILSKVIGKFLTSNPVFARNRFFCLYSVCLWEQSGLH